MPLLQSQREWLQELRDSHGAEGEGLNVEAGTAIIERMTTRNSCVQPPPVPVSVQVMTCAHLDALFIGVLPLLSACCFSPRSSITEICCTEWEGTRIVSISFASLGASCHRGNPQMAIFGWNLTCKWHNPPRSCLQNLL